MPSYEQVGLSAGEKHALKDVLGAITTAGTGVRTGLGLQGVGRSLLPPSPTTSDCPAPITGGDSRRIHNIIPSSSVDDPPGRRSTLRPALKPQKEMLTSGHPGSPSAAGSGQKERTVRARLPQLMLSEPDSTGSSPHSATPGGGQVATPQTTKSFRKLWRTANAIMRANQLANLVIVEDSSFERVKSAAATEPSARSPAELDRLAKYLRSTERLRNINLTGLKEFARTARLERVRQGQYVFDGGDPVQAFYVVLEGKLVQRPDDREDSDGEGVLPPSPKKPPRGVLKREISILNQDTIHTHGSTFGEMEIMSSEDCRESSVECQSSVGLLLAIEASKFREVISGRLSSALQAELEVLKKLPDFRSLRDHVLTKLVFCFKEQEYLAGAVIAQQGNLAKQSQGCVMWILSGTVSCYVDPLWAPEDPKARPETDASKLVHVCDLTGGAALGETCLVAARVTRRAVACSKVRIISVGVGDLRKRFPEVLFRNLEQAARWRIEHDEALCREELARAAAFSKRVSRHSDTASQGGERGRSDPRSRSKATQGSTSHIAISQRHEVAAGHGLWRVQGTEPPSVATEEGYLEGGRSSMHFEHTETNELRRRRGRRGHGAVVEDKSRLQWIRDSAPPPSAQETMPEDWPEAGSTGRPPKNLPRNPWNIGRGGPSGEHHTSSSCSRVSAPPPVLCVSALLGDEGSGWRDLLDDVIPSLGHHSVTLRDADNRSGDVATCLQGDGFGAEGSLRAERSWPMMHSKGAEKHSGPGRHFKKSARPTQHSLTASDACGTQRIGSVPTTTVDRSRHGFAPEGGDSPEGLAVLPKSLSHCLSIGAETFLDSRTLQLLGAAEAAQRSKTRLKHGQECQRQAESNTATQARPSGHQMIPAWMSLADFRTPDTSTRRNVVSVIHDG